MAPALSVSRMVTVKVPALFGVPLMAPVAEFNVMPLGKAPLLTDQLYGSLPPAAANHCEYVAPAVPLGSGDAVTMLSGEPGELTEPSQFGTSDAGKPFAFSKRSLKVSTTF